MDYRKARSLDTLLKQVNEAFPDRDKSSDGWIGDTSHASRKSDHNPNAAGVVNAIDITHDPSTGCDAGKLADRLRVARDPRLSYVISNHRIASEKDNWKWRPYSGVNAHEHHCHISVKNVSKLYDDTKLWKDVVLEGMAKSKIGNAQVVAAVATATTSGGTLLTLADTKTQVQQIAAISDAGGQIVGHAVTVVKVVPMGFWSGVLGVVTNPVFIGCALLVSLAAAGLTWYWRYQMKKDDVA